MGVHVGVVCVLMCVRMCLYVYVYLCVLLGEGICVVCVRMTGHELVVVVVVVDWG